MREDWVQVRLGEFIPDAGSSLDPRKHPNQTFELYSVPSHETRQPELVKGKEIGAAKQRVDNDWVLLSRINPHLNRCWVVRSSSDREKIASSEWVMFPPNDAFIPDYLGYYLVQSRIKNLMLANISGVGGSLTRTNKNAIKEFDLSLPPLPEQLAIVGKLEHLFSELDSGIAELQRAQEKLKVYRQALLKKAFEGELTGQRSRKGDARKGWTVVRLEELMESVRNGSSMKPDDSGKHRILRISSVRPFALDLQDVRMLEEPLEEKDEVLENDLLFTRYNGSRDYVGVCARVPSFDGLLYYPDKLIRCRPILKDAMHSKYLEYAANCGVSREFIRQKVRTTAGQSGISGGDVKNTPIPLCSIEEQHEIVQAIESRLSVCDKLVESIATNLQKAEALRQSILKKAFEGRLLSTAELAACRKEKDWCPAGELLQRVQRKTTEQKPKRRSRTTATVR